MSIDAAAVCAADSRSIINAPAAPAIPAMKFRREMNPAISLSFM
jgi:hypothetical protein